ncbi:MAG: DUF1080 domain-containing protein [Marinoscillum sp.]
MRATARALLAICARPVLTSAIKGGLDPRHCISSSSKTYPWDQWVNGELIVYSDSLILHVVEGDTVLQYSKPQIGGEVANGYDSAMKVNGTPLTKGYIGLQAEGQGIEFKDILIRELEYFFRWRRCSSSQQCVDKLNNAQC